MTKCAALDLAPHGIRVNTILPGLIDTPMARSNGPEQVAQAIEMIPARRLGRPEEIAQVAVYLASGDASYVSGAELTVDGGFFA